MIEEKDPMVVSFMYGLRAPDTKRQYPRRFQYFLNFLSIEGTLDEQAKQFTLKARQNSQSTQESLKAPTIKEIQKLVEYPDRRINQMYAPWFRHESG